MRTSFFILAILAICSVGFAVPVKDNQGPAITIVRSEFEDEGAGTYHYAYENSDGTKAEQKGYVKNPGSENPIQVMEGSFSWFGPDGVLYETTYIADEEGYRPTGTHLKH